MKRTKFLTKAKRLLHKEALSHSERKLREPIRKESRTDKIKVYWGGGRRWFSIKQAAKAEAKYLIREKCDCYNDVYQCSDGAMGGSPCRYHQMSSQRWKFLRDRLAKRILYYWRKSHASQKEANRKAKENSSAQVPSQSLIESGSSISRSSPDAEL
jgi:hypothetical protein